MPKKIKYLKFETCEIKECNKPGIYMWFCQKVLCSEHADVAFKKYMKKLLASLAVIIIGIFIILNLSTMDKKAKNTCPLDECKKEMYEDSQVYYCESCGTSIPKDANRHEGKPEKTVLVDL